jgi:hypothetical protein
MDARDFARLENASRTAMAYIPDDTAHNANRLLTAALPALGILLASALMLATVL